MLRTLDVIMICGMIGAAAWTFKVKADAQVAMDRVNALEKQIAEEREEIALLKADWSLFTSPDRLQRLVDRFGDELDLHPTQSSQIARFGELPPYRRDRLRKKSPLLDGFAELDRDTKTGAVPLTGGLLTPKDAPDE